LARHEISPFSHREKAAAARSTGLRPIHFSNRGNSRGFTSALHFAAFPFSLAIRRIAYAFVWQTAGSALKRPASSQFFRQKTMRSATRKSAPRFRTGEIRALDSSGNVERTIPFDEVDRKL